MQARHEAGIEPQSSRLEPHGGTVGEDLGNSGGDLVGVVAHGGAYFAPIVSFAAATISAGIA